MKGKKGRSAHCNKSCLVMVGVLLASRAFQHNNSHVNRIFQQNNPRCSHQIQIQKPGTRPNSASPIASSQQLSSHLYPIANTQVAPLQAIATHARTETSIQKKNTRIRDGWREDSWDLLLGIHVESSPAGRTAVRPGLPPASRLLLRRLRRADRAEASIAGGRRGDAIGNGEILRWAERRVI